MINAHGCSFAILVAVWLADAFLQLCLADEHPKLDLIPRDEPYLHFSIDLVDTSSTHLNNPCGWIKCLFYADVDRMSTSSSSSLIKSSKSTIGFLVTGYDSEKYRRLVKTWSFIKKLKTDAEQSKVNFYHVYLSAPQIVKDGDNGDTKIGRWLDQQNNKSAQSIAEGVAEQSEEDRLKNPIPKFSYFDKFIVQEVNVINDSEALIIGCGPTKVKKFWNDVDRKYLIPLREQMTIEQRQVIANTLHEQMNELYHILDHYPCLYNDIQVFLLRDGSLVHFDIERCFEVHTWRTHEECFDIVDKKFQYLLASLVTPETEFRNRDSENKWHIVPKSTIMA